MTWTNLCCLLPILKLLKSNPNCTVTLTPKFTGSFSSLRFFFGDASVYKGRTWQIVRNLFHFFPQFPCMISWNFDKSRDFQTSFAFFKNLKTIRPHVRGRVSWTRRAKFLFISRVRPHIGLNNMNIIFYPFYSIIWVTCSSNLTYTKKFLEIQ